MEHGQFDKAVELLVKSKQFHEALDLCMNHNITLTEDMVERMSIPKKPHGNCYTKIMLNTSCNFYSLILVKMY